MFNFTDSHIDLLTARTYNEQIEFIHNLPTNIKVLNLAIFTTDNKININQLEKYKQHMEYLQSLTKTLLLFSIEDIGSVSPNEIDDLIKLKPFCVGLTWNYKNQYAGGALSTNGLKKCGKDVIKKLEENNILIDIAHLNRKSFYAFCKITTKPILCTHANLNSLFRHPRNLTNRQIKNIIDSNGFLGLTLYESFISNKAITAKDVAMQVDYLIKKFGDKNFGFGTDFFGITENKLPTDIKQYADFKNISNELKQLGHPFTTIQNIFFKNFVNFLKRTNKL